MIRKNLTVPTHESSLEKWLYYLKHLHYQSIDLGLERVNHVATSLNLLYPAPLIITVSGTNGKGTTCKLLEMILLANGMRVGVYSSPHLLHYTERVRIQGCELPETMHTKAMAMIQSGIGNISLSFFEFGTLAALYLFQKASLDVVILEVGLGGRLDATNIIDPDIAIITSIGLDHINLLGSDRTSIAQEKAGIFRQGKPAIVGERDWPKIVQDNKINNGAILYICEYDWWWHEDKKSWHWWNNSLEFNRLPIPFMPLENAATALASITCLPFKVTEKAIKQGLNDAILPGRFQCISQSPLMILDVAHNPHAASYLAYRLSLLPRTGKIRAVVGMLIDKDIGGTLSCLRNQVDIWYCASLDGPRGATAEHLVSYLDKRAKQFNNISNAWFQAIQDAALEDCILCFGSFHTVAHVMKLNGMDKKYEQ